MNDESRIQSTPNLSRYFVYTALKGFGFGLITAMWLIYLQQRRGFSLTQATFIDVAFWIAAALSEIPTGIVADTFGRKTSLTLGAILLSTSIFAWAIVPTMPLIMVAYMGLAVGTTFLTGADDALFYESLKAAGRTSEYTALVGRMNVVLLGATALGSVASGIFASIDLILPFLIAGFSLLTMLGIVLTFKEPPKGENLSSQTRKPFGEVLRQSLALIGARPTLRYSILYLALVPLAAVILETFFLQPQAVALGVPIALIGVVVMVVQITNMIGSAWSQRIQVRLSDDRVLYIAPVIIVLSLILLAVLQIIPGLLFITMISFVTAVLRPMLLSRIQAEVPDDIRATLLSVQSLMFTLLLTASEPILGSVADRSGLPAAYIGLAGSLSALVVFLFWRSRNHFPHAATAG